MKSKEKLMFIYLVKVADIEGINNLEEFHAAGCIGV